MSIRKRGKRAYQVRVSGFPAVTVPTREAAEALELDLKVRRSVGDLYVEAPSTLGDEIDAYLAWKKATGALSVSGARFLDQSAAFWRTWRDTPLSRLRRAELEDAIAIRAAKHARSARNELEFLKAVLKRAGDRGQRYDSAILGIAPVKHHAREGRALEPDELLALASWLPDYLRRLPLLAGSVGLRLSEWLNMTADQLELDAKPDPLIRIAARTVGSKSKRAKAIPLTGREAQLLREQLLVRAPGSPFVFPRRHGTRFNPENFRHDYWTPAVEASGLGDVHFHDLRHTAISMMARAGYRVEWIAERVGHTDGGALILRRYRHLYPSEMSTVSGQLDALFADSGGQGKDKGIPVNEKTP